MEKNIVGLKNTLNFDYQKDLHLKTKEIMQGKEEISLETLKNNSIFSKACSNLDNEVKTSLFDKIVSISGDMIDKVEMKTILILLDANLESVRNKSLQYTHGLNVQQKKFVLDGKNEVSKQSGIFQATEDEIKTLKEVLPLYDFDKNEMFPDMLSNGTPVLKDRDGNIVDQQ